VYIHAYTYIWLLLNIWFTLQPCRLWKFSRTFACMRVFMYVCTYIIQIYMNDDVYIHTRTYRICTCIYTCMLWHICMIYIHIYTNMFSHWYTYNTRTLSRLRILNAKANHIVLLPDMLGLKSLQNLNVSDNDLEYINPSVQGLSALTVFINKYVRIYVINIYRNIYIHRLRYIYLYACIYLYISMSVCIYT